MLEPNVHGRRTFSVARFCFPSVGRFIPDRLKYYQSADALPGMVAEKKRIFLLTRISKLVVASPSRVGELVLPGQRFTR